MANDQRFVVESGLQTQNIEYLSSSGTDIITVSMLDGGTLSYSGTAGQLFSITNSLTGTIFAVNDISGVPSIEVDDTGVVRIAQYTGNVLIGTAIDNGTDKLQVSGNINTSGTLITANISYTGTLTGSTGIINIGSGQFYKDTSGNIGISNTTPQAALHIAGTNRSLSLAGLSAGQGNASYLLMGNSDSAGTTGPNVIVSANRVFQVGVGTSFTSPSGGTFTSYLYIDASGRIGIRTSPNYDLHITGTGYATGDFRAPYFYDSGNTSFYIKPAGNSILNTTYLVGGQTAYNTGVPANTGSTNTQIQRIYAGTTSGYGEILDIGMNVVPSYAWLQATNWGNLGIFYGLSLNPNGGYVSVNTASNNGYNLNVAGTIGATTSLNSPIFYDSNNTAYYVDPASTSNLNALTVGGYSVLTTGAYDQESNDYSYTHTQITADTGDFNQTNFTLRSALGSISTTANGPFGDNFWYTYANIRHRGGSGDGNLWGSQIAIGMTSANNRIAFRTQSNGTWNSWYELVSYNNNVGTGALYAGIYYDSNNTAYYADPSSTSNFLGLTVSNTITGSVSGNAGSATSLTGAGIAQTVNRSQLFNNQGYNHSTFTSFSSTPDFGLYFVHQDAGVTDGPGGLDQYYVLNQGLGNDYSYSQYGMQTAINRYGYGNPYLNIRFKENGSWTGWNKIYAGYADTAGSSSSTSNITATSPQLAAATESNSIYVTSPSYTTDQPVKLLNFDWYGNVWSISNIRSGSTPTNGFGVFYTASGGTIAEMARFYTNGNFRAIGDVIAYSDVSLKENVKTIDNALKKVISIRGVTFTRNDLENKEKIHMGVIAQEVEKYVPEVVIDGEIKSVAYGNMVGLLIEAIKEQDEKYKSEIAELRSMIDELTKLIKG